MHQLEMHSQIIPGVGHHIVTIPKKTGELKLEATLTDQAIEHALLRNKIPLIFRHKGTDLTQLDGVANFSIALIPHGQVINLPESIQEGTN